MARRHDVLLVLTPNHVTEASGVPVPRRSCSTGYADWMFGRGMKVFAAAEPSATTYASRRDAIGKTRQRMYATKVAIARSTAQMTAELISLRMM